MLGVLGFSVSLIIEWWDDRSYTPREPDFGDTLDKHIEMYTLDDRTWLFAHYELSQGKYLRYLELIGVAEEKKPTHTHSYIATQARDAGQSGLIRPPSLGHRPEWHPHEMTDVEIDGYVDRYILDYPPVL
jgi:hypothetical protein